MSEQTVTLKLPWYVGVPVMLFLFVVLFGGAAVVLALGATGLVCAPVILLGSWAQEKIKDRRRVVRRAKRQAQIRAVREML